MKVLLITTFALYFNSCFSNEFKHDWTNGHVKYATNIEGNLIRFDGHDPHEGGYYCLTQQLNDSTLKITTNEISTNTSIGEIGFIIQLTYINKAPILKVVNKENKVIEVFVTADGISINEIHKNDNIKFELYGDYESVDKSSKLSFNTDNQKINIDDQTFNYEFGTELDFLSNVIILDNVIKYYYEKSGRSLKLYFTKKEGNVWQKLNLHKEYITETNFPIPFLASKEILTKGQLNFFAKKQLRVLRNEIFARQGYIFQSDLMEYFIKQEWYQPNIKAEIKLSKLEILNIALIKEVEKSKNE